MNKLTISSLLLLFSTAFAVPKAIAQTPDQPNDTRVEKYEDLTQPEVSQSEMETTEMEQGEMKHGEGMGTEGAQPPTTRTEEKQDEAQSGDMQSGDMQSGGMQSGEDMGTEGAQPPTTRTEEKQDEAQSGDMQSGGMQSGGMDVRRTEAFNLVSSAYRGDFEKQGINGYQVLISNYEQGQLTAEDLIKAGIDSGEVSPSAMKDDSYIEAVDSQLMSLTNR